MSMVMVFDDMARQLGVQHGIFDCAATYDEAVTREGDWSLLLLDSGYNIDSMQSSYNGIDWRAWKAKHRDTPITRTSDGFGRCEDIELGS